jgi:hypothetical protein
VNLTPKLGGIFSLVPKHLYFDLGTFFTLAPLVQFPYAAYRAWTYGVNARLSWRMPIPGPIRWGLDAGWYFWGMLVPARSYGLAYATGPQFLLSLRSRDYAKYRWGMYFKWAPLTNDQFRMVLTNREIAFGLSLGTPMHVNLRPVSINIDIAHFKYASSNGAAKADMATATLGFSFPLAKPDPRYLATQPALPIPLRAPGASATKSNGVAPTSSVSAPPGPSAEGTAGNSAPPAPVAPAPPVAPSSSSAAPAAKPQSAPKKR